MCIQLTGSEKIEGRYDSCSQRAHKQWQKQTYKPKMFNSVTKQALHVFKNEPIFQADKACQGKARIIREAAPVSSGLYPYFPSVWVPQHS